MTATYTASSVSPVVAYASTAVPSIASLSNPQAGPDGTAALQALMNLNASGGPYAGQALEIVIDQPILCANVSVNANTIVRGLGGFRSGVTYNGTSYTGTSPPSGLWLKSIPTSGPGSTNSCILKNANWSSNYLSGSASPAQIVDSNITIRDLFLDGQRRNGVASGGYHNTPGQFVSPLQLYGVSGLRLENVSVFDTCCYAIHVTNISGGTFRDLYVMDPVFHHDPTVAGRNTDGLHLNGPCDRILVDGFSGCSGDDFLAFNAIDVPSTTSFGSYSYVYCGNITNVEARNLIGDGARNVMRILTGTDLVTGQGTVCNATNITVGGITGTFGGFLAGYSEGGSGSGGTKSGITIADVCFTPIAVYQSIGLDLGGTWNDLTVIDWKSRDFLAGDNSGILVCESDLSLTFLHVIGRSIVADASDTGSPPIPFEFSQGSFVFMKFSDCEWTRSTATTTTQPFAQIDSGVHMPAIEFRGLTLSRVAAALNVVSGSTPVNVTSSGLAHYNANGSASFTLGATVAQFTAGCSNTAQLYSGTAPTSIQTDNTQRS